MTDHDEADCPRCLDCPGCDGGNDNPLHPVIDRSRPGIVLLYCGDCDGNGVICDCPCHPKDQP